MPNKRNVFASRTDGNAKEIDAALIAHGVVVCRTDAIGKGFPDRVCGYQGLTVLIEYKRDYSYDRGARGIEHVKGKLNPDQVAWHAAWKGQPVVIARSPAEALAAFGLE